MCFEKHIKLRVKGMLVCQWRQICPKCNFSITIDFKHEWNKKFCTNCNMKQPRGHFCYVTSLKRSRLVKNFMFFFFNTEWTQDLEKRVGSFEYEYQLRTMRQACHLFWEDSISNFIEYLLLSRSFVD